MNVTAKLPSPSAIAPSVRRVPRTTTCTVTEAPAAGAPLPRVTVPRIGTGVPAIATDTSVYATAVYAARTSMTAALTAELLSSANSVTARTGSTSATR